MVPFVRFGQPDVVRLAQRHATIVHRTEVEVSLVRTSVGNLRVYASAGASPASNTLGLGRLGVAIGLQPRGLIYTDRPAYRPGEKVCYRGVVRLVAKGSYDTGKGQKLTVRALSARGDVVHESEQALSEFGTLNGEFTLNARDPLGQYRIVASMGEGKPTFTGQFRVDEYQPPL